MAAERLASIKRYEAQANADNAQAVLYASQAKRAEQTANTKRTSPAGNPFKPKPSKKMTTPGGDTYTGKTTRADEKFGQEYGDFSRDVYGAWRWITDSSSALGRNVFDWYHKE